MTPWTVACQVPLSMEFSRHEYWSGLPFSSPGDLPHPGIKAGSPALQVDFRFFSIISYYKILNIVPCDILGNLFIFLSIVCVSVVLAFLKSIVYLFYK